MTTAAEQTARTFFPERMYTFLVEVTRPKYRSLNAYVPFGCSEAQRGMCGSARQKCPERKFGLRTMKSLRKTALLILVLALPVFALFLAAQTAQQPAPSPATQSPPSQPAPRAASTVPQSEAQTKISVNSNLVILPVTVKDRSGNLAPDLRPYEFHSSEDNG